MRRILILLLLALPAVGLVACAGSSSSQDPGTPATATTPANATSDDTCPVLDPGPPPKCPEGCVWNGSECRKQGGIIMPNDVDAGPPTASQ